MLMKRLSFLYCIFLPLLSQISWPHLLLDHVQFTLIHGPNIPGSYAILFFIASDFITRQIHNWVLFLLWLPLFILSGVISPLFSKSILGTYRPEEFIFQCPIFLPFHTVHGVLKTRIWKWFAIPFSSGPHFVRTLHCDQNQIPYDYTVEVTNIFKGLDLIECQMN